MASSSEKPASSRGVFAVLKKHPAASLYMAFLVFYSLPRDVVSTIAKIPSVFVDGLTAGLVTTARRDGKVLEPKKLDAVSKSLSERVAELKKGLQGCYTDLKKDYDRSYEEWRRRYQEFGKDKTVAKQFLLDSRASALNTLAIKSLKRFITISDEEVIELQKPMFTKNASLGVLLKFIAFMGQKLGELISSKASWLKVMGLAKVAFIAKTIISEILAFTQKTIILPRSIISNFAYGFADGMVSGKTDDVKIENPVSLDSVIKIRNLIRQAYSSVKYKYSQKVDSVPNAYLYDYKTPLTRNFFKDKVIEASGGPRAIKAVTRKLFDVIDSICAASVASTNIAAAAVAASGYIAAKSIKKVVRAGVGLGAKKS